MTVIQSHALRLEEMLHSASLSCDQQDAIRFALDAVYYLIDSNTDASGMYDMYTQSMPKAHAPQSPLMKVYAYSNIPNGG